MFTKRCIPASSSTKFFKVIHLTIYSHEHKIRDHHRIQTQTTHKKWVITFLNKIQINKDIININYRSIYNIVQLNTIHITLLYHLKFIFKSPIMLCMNHTLESRRNNTHQFHNKQFTVNVTLFCKNTPTIWDQYRLKWALNSSVFTPRPRLQRIRLGLTFLFQVQPLKQFLHADTAHELYNTHDLTLVFQTRLTFCATI